MGELIVLVSFAVFVWAVVGLINPKAARLPNRITSVWIWLLSVALAVVGGSLMPDAPAEPASEEAAASAPASPTPPPSRRDSASGAADGGPTNNVTAAPSGSSASGNLTAPQRNAVRSANSYLLLSGFSRQGLIDQLSSEFGDRYSVGDATVAVDSLSIDWNAQAARSAVSYLAVVGILVSGPDRPAVLRVR